MDQLYRLKVNVILKETGMTKRKAFRSKAITNEELDAKIEIRELNQNQCLILNSMAQKWPNLVFRQVGKIGNCLQKLAPQAGLEPATR